MPWQSDDSYTQSISNRVRPPVIHVKCCRRRLFKLPLEPTTDGDDRWWIYLVVVHWVRCEFIFNQTSTQRQILLMHVYLPRNTRLPCQEEAPLRRPRMRPSVNAFPFLFFCCVAVCLASHPLCVCQTRIPTPVADPENKLRFKVRYVNSFEDSVTSVITSYAKKFASKTRVRDRIGAIRRLICFWYLMPTLRGGNQEEML